MLVVGGDHSLQDMSEIDCLIHLQSKSMLCWVYQCAVSYILLKTPLCRLH